MLNNHMLSEIRDFVKAHFNDIMLFMIIVLLLLLAFAAGYITAKYGSRSEITISSEPKK